MLHVRLEDEADARAVEAVREGRTLYLTGWASPATAIDLVSDFIGGSQSRSDVEQAIRGFIAMGRSQNPGQVIVFQGARRAGGQKWGGAGIGLILPSRPRNRHIHAMRR